MVPLTYFLIAWILLLGVFGIFVLLTLIQMLRHGLPSAAAYFSTFVFLLVALGVMLWTGWYLTGVDWTISVSVVPQSILPFFFGSQG